MAGTTFKRKNKNRYRKNYPYIRKRPVYEYASDKELIIEAGEVTFTSTSGPVAYNFTQTFRDTPSVVAISVDSESNNMSNVNIFIKTVNSITVQFESSEPFTGKVHFHAIEVVE